MQRCLSAASRHAEVVCVSETSWSQQDGTDCKGRQQTHRLRAYKFNGNKKKKKNITLQVQ